MRWPKWLWKGRGTLSAAEAPGWAQPEWPLEPGTKVRTLVDVKVFRGPLGSFPTKIMIEDIAKGAEGVVTERFGVGKYGEKLIAVRFLEAEVWCYPKCLEVIS